MQELATDKNWRSQNRVWLKVLKRTTNSRKKSVHGITSAWWIRTRHQWQRDHQDPEHLQHSAHEHWHVKAQFSCLSVRFLSSSGSRVLRMLRHPRMKCAVLFDLESSIPSSFILYLLHFLLHFFLVPWGPLRACALRLKREWTLLKTPTSSQQTWDSPTTCCCSQHPKNSYVKCCVNSKGLRIHSDKTKILSNQSIINSDTKELEIEDMKIEILTRNENVKYLGQKISFHHQETTEKNRIRAAWATFRKYRQELTSKNYVLNHRLQLFDAAISRTMSYAARTWHASKNTKEWFNRRNARCYDSSLKQKKEIQKDRETRN